MLVPTLVTGVDRHHRFFRERKLRIEELVALLGFGILDQRFFGERLFLCGRTQIENGVNLLFRSSHWRDCILRRHGLPLRGGLSLAAV